MSGGSEADQGWRDRPWCIVGCGRVGTALCHIARNLEVDVTATWNRTQSAADRVESALEVGTAMTGDELSDLPALLERAGASGAVVWLTVADDALVDMAEQVAPELPESAICLHTCGSRGAELLASAGAECAYGVAHPLWAVSDPERAADGLSRATWSVEGTRVAVDWVTGFVDELGARIVTLDEGDRAVYHAAAVMAANLMVGALEAAVQLAGYVGMSRSEAHAALWPLAISALENVRDGLEPGGLTGPVARGDETTIDRHLDAIDATGDAALRSVYASLTEMCQRLMRRED